MASIMNLYVLLIPLILIGFLFLAFWIMMIVDAAGRKFKGDSDKVVWILIIILLGFLGALIYYFVIYFKDKKKSMRWLWWTILGLFILFILILILLVLLTSPAGI